MSLAIGLADKKSGAAPDGQTMTRLRQSPVVFAATVPPARQLPDASQEKVYEIDDKI